MQDASGVQEFKYGILGQLIENIHTFVLPGSDKPYTFAMNWDYDIWNRIKKIQYPDGEIVTYNYNATGSLTSILGQKGIQSWDYLSDIKYNHLGQKVKVNYGNGAKVQYDYNPLNHRLDMFQSWDGQNHILQDLHYIYDPVGNINQIMNNANDVNGFGGVYDYTYQYDSLYRLIDADGNFSNNSIDYPFELALTYSKAGDILTKSLTVDQMINGGLINKIYSFDYNYIGNSHKISAIDDGINAQNYSFTWDANGNMTSRTHVNNSITRTQCWDEENRLTLVRDPNRLSHYVYNAGGERVWKLSGEISTMTMNGVTPLYMANINQSTLYANPYFVVTDNEYTKHYYMEEQRFVSKLGGGLANAVVDPLNGTLQALEGDITSISEDLFQNLENTLDNCSGSIQLQSPEELQVINGLYGSDNTENLLYYYHTDHLGSSSWITDASGNAIQHLQYLPFGEDFVSQQSTSFASRYTFSAII